MQRKYLSFKKKFIYILELNRLNNCILDIKSNI
jgi:hypothetical protein